MSRSEDELKALSGSTVPEIQEALPDLDAKEIAALYAMEVAKSTPRNSVTDMLLKAGATDSSEDEEEEEEEADDGTPKFNAKLPHNMVWHEGTKCILQGKNIFDRVTKVLIK